MSQLFDDGSPDDLEIAGYKLKRTCYACPEQYDVFIDGKEVGYLRLRHGHFRADYPTCGGREVFSANPRGDGIFESDERMAYLTGAIQAIHDARKQDDDIEAAA